MSVSRYIVTRAKNPVVIDADWEKPCWQNVQPTSLTHCMGDKPGHLPKTEVKMAYDSQNIYIIFRVEDRYVKAVEQARQSMVFRDSCVEFFFTPGPDVSQGYFNLEVNCGGTIYLYHNTGIRTGSRPISDGDLDLIQIARSLPRIISEEITEPVVWTLECRLPVSVLSKYAQVEETSSGKVWRANFYKCGDETSHPHWLTWAKIDRPLPDFHQPDFFGELIFE